MASKIEAFDQSAAPQTNDTLLEGLNDREYSIVYIEDNESNLRLVESLFDKYSNLKLFTAKEGVAGIALCEKVIPDLILLDINLPGEDGFKILEKLRQIKDLKEKPIVAVSANAMEHDIVKGLEHGFDGYVVKPINLSMLLETVKRQLSKSTDSGGL